ncbi:MAG: patatin-like phospholipase family protein [Microscillaceae bacterium]
MLNKKLTRILSLDGGGIRGIIPGQILVKLEQMLQNRTGDRSVKLADYFDLIAGTSTGGILACVYLTPDKVDNKRPLYRAEDAVDLYMEHGDEIFSVSWMKKLRSASGLIDEKYPSAPIESLLEKYFGNLELKQLIKPCLISAYDVHDSKAFFFTQQDARLHEGQNFLIRDVARATSAAPTYFEAAKVTSMSGVTYPLIDGGVFANNPSLCAYAEARQWDFGPDKLKPNAAEMMIVSIGNGGASRMRLTHDKIKNWGTVEWIKPLINIMMSGVNQTVHYQLKQIYQAVGKVEQYIRIEPDLNNAKSDMDDASPKNLKALKEAGIKASENEDIAEKLERIVQMLLDNH